MHLTEGHGTPEQTIKRPEPSKHLLFITMPEISQTNTIQITPERFLNACSPAELFDIDRLIQQQRYQNKIENMMKGFINENSAEAPKKPVHGTKTKYRKRCSHCEKLRICTPYATGYLCDNCFANYEACANNVLQNGEDVAEQPLIGTNKTIENRVLCTVCKRNHTDHVYQGHPTCVSCSASLSSNY